MAGGDRVGNVIETIIIPVYNAYEKLQRCVESIDIPVKNLLIINNGVGRVDVPHRAENQIVLEMPSNLGVGPAWNLGIKLFPWSSGWVFLNSDAWFEPGAAQVFASCFKRDNIVLAGVPGWCCAYVGDEVVGWVGLFSECYVPAYFEDVDYERRATDAGISVVKSGANVNHDNASTIRSDDRLNAMHMGRFRINRDLHNKRWFTGTPEAGHWDLRRRRELGWDAT